MIDFDNYRWYRMLVGGTWYLHRFNYDAYDLHLDSYPNFWARYGNINRYSTVIKTEYYYPLIHENYRLFLILIFFTIVNIINQPLATILLCIWATIKIKLKK